MKKITNQFYGSHVGRMNYGGAKFCRFALFPLMLFMLLLLPTRMVAQADYDTSVTFSALKGTPEGRVFKIRLKFGTFFSRIIGLTN